MKHAPALLALLVVAAACGASTPPARTTGPTATAAPVPAPGPVAAPARTTIIVGDEVEVVDAGEAYTTINATDCLTWPSPAIKARGGEGSWAGYTPKNGHFGKVLGLSKHCSAPETEIAILDIGGYAVPIGIKGLRIAPVGSVAKGGFGTGRSGFGGGLGMGSGGSSAGGIFAVGDAATIVDEGQMYTTINSSDCLTWPSAEIKARASYDSWGSFVPTNGHVGTVLGTSKHCDSGVIVAILDVSGNIIAIGESGLAKGGTPGAAPPFAVGNLVTITDAGELFSMINRNDCLTWPSAEIKAAGGVDGWTDGFYPSNGHVGTVLGTSPHCDQPGVIIVFISVGKYYVAIGAAGLTRR